MITMMMMIVMMVDDGEDIDDGVGELCQLGEHQLSQPNLFFSSDLFVCVCFGYE